MLDAQDYEMIKYGGMKKSTPLGEAGCECECLRLAHA